MNEIDEYMQKHLPPHHQEIVTIVRTLMREEAPEAQETISRGSPAWKAAKLLAIISRSKTHITLAFTRGAEFTDPHGLLEGKGKTTRHVRLKDPTKIDKEALRAYIHQALTLDHE
ncbi:DUF1801 domain-containing protein [Actinomadura syzygii]|uniref:DUF1801 domain-containing protein n=1 Tax=Actinomadura syzygii TaxID=1427538 RepID=A0A5D0UJ20_9ACTN|nr:DUF1801 domain-containing protein [Actinomadura syzygii]TYC17632.1 DUF1801 domain-containing protein [Actinomadura syzygii]